MRARCARVCSVTRAHVARYAYSTLREIDDACSYLRDGRDSMRRAGNVIIQPTPCDIARVSLLLVGVVVGVRARQFSAICFRRGAPQWCAPAEMAWRCSRPSYTPPRLSLSLILPRVTFKTARRRAERYCHEAVWRVERATHRRRHGDAAAARYAAPRVLRQSY